MKKPVALVIMDGWGIRFAEEGNAVVQGNTPNYDRFLKHYECSILDASGEAVGLQDGQMGNSEVGHLNIGAGRIVRQSISRINHAIASKELENMPQLTEKLKACKESGKNFHLVGLLGPGGVHSHTDHLLALIDICAAHAVTPALHLIADGRDTPPRSTEEFYEVVGEKVDAGKATIATMGGRYYYMDRDNRWERTSIAYQVMTGEAGAERDTFLASVEEAYNADENDEFITPAIITPAATVKDGDTLLFFNFRADRMRQIVKVFAGAEIPDFPVARNLKDLSILTMTQYESDLDVDLLFPPQNVVNPLAKVLSDAGMKQYHIAETEKYAHVTYFFNGGDEVQFEGEDREMVPSPKVDTYDLQPEMNARIVADRTIERLKSGVDDFILVNFANPDMVGHSGKLDAVIKAVEAVDICVGDIVAEVLKRDGTVLLTADHGNSELIVDFSSGQPHTYHTTSPVPFIFITKEKLSIRPRGILADIAPTVLGLLGVSVPDEFERESLILGS
ncbi:MAG: 2,3-bisphosphoglycerate-independent phosphoglycerate mutase [Anaerolineae bacterium]|nr:2,3-bisphosphoglycerate-independent phosphoglycerate mutase [Anaerolineae bacterium]MBT7073257.1 2,3-bisphosphoglycerate-independent phosphoglycerate mutase [Anaerolineae bacterium]MBT7325327.1 2,3-bisphosphoglycerate-independent phosphoglycerate mutase [Anaerolineae bacterium]